jgi:hypothetical protein
LRQSRNQPEESLVFSVAFPGGNGPLDLSGISLASPFAATDTCGNSVASLSSCTINVTFAAHTLGNFTGQVSVVDNTPQGKQSIPVYGTGVVDFSIAPASPSLTMQSGGQATDVMTFVGIGGSFTNPIQLTCAVSGPAPLPSCSMSSLSVTPGANSVTSTLTVTAPAATAKQLPVETHPFAGLLLAAFIPLMSGMCFVHRRRARVRMHMLIFSLCLLLLLMSACGGGNSGSTGNPGPPPQTYTVTVTATSGTLDHTAQVTLIFN